MKNQEKAVLPSANIDELENMLDKCIIQFKLERDEEQGLHYQRTISSICNLVRSFGWHFNVFFPDTSDVIFTLKRNQKL